MRKLRFSNNLTIEIFWRYTNSTKPRMPILSLRICLKGRNCLMRLSGNFLLYQWGQTKWGNLCGYYSGSPNDSKLHALERDRTSGYQAREYSGQKFGLQEHQTKGDRLGTGVSCRGKQDQQSMWNPIVRGSIGFLRQVYGPLWYVESWSDGLHYADRQHALQRNKHSIDNKASKKKHYQFQKDRVPKSITRSSELHHQANCQGWEEKNDCCRSPIPPLDPKISETK